MTPQIQQFFGAQILATGPSAVISDISGDAVLEIGLVPDDPGALFVQLMQDGVVGNEGVLAPLQTAPHPPAPFGQGVAAMFMLERACNLPAGKVTVVEDPAEDPAAGLTDMGEDTARDLIADQPNPLLVMLTIPVAIFGKPPPTPKLVTAPANAPDDTVGYAPKPLALGPPLSDLMGEDLSRVSAAAVTQPDAGTFAPPVTENRKDLLPATQPLVAVTAGIPTAIAAPIVASVPLFAAIAQGKEAPYTAGAPVAGIVTANTAAAPAEMRPIGARATPAETAFRLRAAATAGTGEISASAINAPLQVSDRAIPKPLAIQPEHGPDEAKATHTPKPESAADSPVLAAIRLPADDVPQPLAVVGADPPKPSAAVVAPPNAAPPPAPAALPPQLSAGLITLAKTAPDGPVEILLNPEELGSLRFEIHQKADQLRVVLSVERPETMDLLRRNADQLLDEFRAAGFSGASLSFGQWDQQSRDPRAPPAPPTSPQDQGFAPPPVPKTLHPPLELALPTGLDMRL